MSENILHISKLTKIIWKSKILAEIDISISKGSVYWFIWANWAWKTTTLKTICWLLKPTSWNIEMFWKPWELNHLSKIGALIEKPVLYEHLNWIDNLKIHTLLTNTPKSRIEEVLNIVGLDSKAAKKQTKKYSLWMKQRLAIAIAILHNPEFIILDEPTNWLDIEWIRSIRELITSMWKMWYTIIVSSHQLSEIEKACTHIWVIAKWKMRFEWTIKEFMKLWWDIEEIYLSLSNSNIN